MDYLKGVLAPYVPVEDGGLMPAGQREALRNAMARTLSGHPPSRNIEDRRDAQGWFQMPSFNPLQLLRPQQMAPFAPPGELSGAAGYWDVGDERRPR
jgi:hypothetical protein